MAHFSSSAALLSLTRQFRRLHADDPLTQCLVPRLRRPFASQTAMPLEQFANEASTPEITLPGTRADSFSPQASHINTLDYTSATHAPPFEACPVVTTLYKWPSLEPSCFTYYKSNQLDLPLRRDLLHRAVIYEADASRQGTASTKWRSEVHGSNRKILPQKGTGKARAGDKKSPIRRGGGVAFGPKPRDFSTKLPKKIYDLAWRTALSHRYRRGELIIIENEFALPSDASTHFLVNFFEENNWGKGNGRTLLVPEVTTEPFGREMAMIGEHGVAKDIIDVDVKDLLETGRVVIERRALNILFAKHSWDLGIRFNLHKTY